MPSGSTPPLAVGVALGGPGDPAGFRRLLETGERAEALGLHSLWLPEGHFAPGAVAAPLVLLAALAARTRTLRLATTSLLLPVHPARRLAASISAVDRLSGGRLLLGLGRGFRADLFGAFGVDPREKRRRFDRTLDELLAFWRNGSVPPPLQAPHPPMLVAAFGPRGLEQAARRGLPYLASPMEDLAQLARNQQHWQRHLAAPPDERAPRAAVIRTVHVAGGDAEARRVREALEREFERLRRRAPALLAKRATGPLSDRVLVGTASEIDEVVARYRELLGMDLLVARTGVPGVTPAEARAAFERLPGLARPGSLNPGGRDSGRIRPG